MSGVLIEILILALFCNGLTYAASEGYLLHWFYKRMSKAPTWVFNPVIGCIYCMASFWGIVIHFALNFSAIELKTFIYLPIVMISGVFVNGLVKDIIDRINRP